MISSIGPKGTSNLASNPPPHTHTGCPPCVCHSLTAQSMFSDPFFRPTSTTLMTYPGSVLHAELPGTFVAHARYCQQLYYVDEAVGPLLTSQPPPPSYVTNTAFVRTTSPKFGMLTHSLRANVLFGNMVMPRVGRQPFIDVRHSPPNMLPSMSCQD